ncbi:Acyl-CoA dehydrogenase domain protein [Desulfatibacillum aliphaticivorans]|uniref:Acyl-CoA dehydrogenase domain protein n=1 Tax=Desulfatibacillum aliphaticivorans TaxID=218208 RepID=B8FIW6_DESAL|nr:acyl-CoA dehydrogenase family protein [Desulfatibacillum aliphaticivorans]ACL04357.1 Acyl-CoA dehydrogenase domain protein [Desulfatibacillum aliphaticivorans]
MDLDLTKEQGFIKSSAREFLKKECPVSTVREMRDDPEGFSRNVWKKMAVLGWQGIMIPEEYDGMGGDFLDLALILEAMGEVCCNGPFFSTVALGAAAIINWGTEEQKKELLPQISKGNLILSLAVAEPQQWYGLDNIQTTLTDTGQDLVLNGTKLFVENAHISDYILCVAQGPGKGLSLVMVDPRSPGVQCSLLSTFAYEKQCNAAFKNVLIPRANILGTMGEMREDLEGLLEFAALAKCLETVGVLQAAFEQSVDYAKSRVQFGRAIGSFQAIQHHCANMVVDVDGARFISYQAAWRVARGLPASAEISMAKAWTGEAAKRVTALSHQIHGAISFCDEFDLHFYYRKAKACEAAFGDVQYHLDKTADRLGLV